jgi:hypothetical protein
MAQNYTKNYKNCAVCNFWGGNRQVNISKQIITVDSSGVQGKCMAKGVPWAGHGKQASSTCNNWMGLGVLK